MQPSAVIVLAEFEDPGDAALLAFDDVGVLGTGASLEEPVAGVRGGRAFVGHAGWGPGSSTPSSSAATGSSSRPGARMRSRPSRASCGAVLTRKGGSYALVARMPADPSVN